MGFKSEFFPVTRYMFPEGINRYLSDRRIIFTTTLLLMAITGYQLSIVLWKVVPQPVTGNSIILSQQTTGRVTETGISSGQMVREITSEYLYGQIEKTVSTTEVVEDAPKSSLSYKLRGIYYSTDESLASIILQKDSNTTNFYRLGDEIDNKIFIHQIQPNHVIISRLGKLEKLVLEKPELEMNQVAGRELPSNNLSTTASGEVLKSYRRRYSNNPMALARRFQAIPVQENGQNVGYKLKALRGEQLLKKLNLQEDDVFVAINGIGLDKPFQALDALKSLTTAKDVSLTVLRNGNRETLDFNL